MFLWPAAVFHRQAKTRWLKACCPQLILTLLVLVTVSASATERYVNVSSASPAPPYTNWAGAATSIQDAIDVADPGDSIFVTNGVYKTGGRAVSGAMTNRVAVTKTVSVESVNGSAVTVIQGYQVPGTTNGNGAIRCVYLTDGASLSGFTLTNGATVGDGGGVFCESTNALLLNCVLTGNSSGGIGGGSYQGTLNNCLLRGNSAFMAGGSMYGVLNNCLIVGNSASYVGGGVFYGVQNNCTIVSNSSTSSGGGAYYAQLNNCIIYYNHGSFDGENTYNSQLQNCCTMQQPGFSFGNDSFTNAPLFVDLAGGDLHLQSNSPCINSGNNALVTAAVDLDGNQRIRGGTVDVGAYEFQATGSGLPYYWLQQFGLAIDGSADFIDSDGDGLNNWQEWRSKTDPMDSSSVLKLAAPILNYSGGTLVFWQSASGVTYFVQRSTNLLAQTNFTTIQTNVAGLEGLTGYIDVPPAGVPVFYRVGVQ